MKRLIIFLLISGLLLAGCGSRLPGIADVIAEWESAENDGTSIDGAAISRLKKAWGTPYSEEPACVVWEHGGRYVAAYVDDGTVTHAGVSETLTATVIEITGTLLIVEPTSPEWVVSSGSRMFMSLDWFSPADASRIIVSTQIQAEFDGIVMESSPLQINKPYELKITG